MTSFYKCLLLIFCFACVSATAIPTEITPTAHKNGVFIPASYAKNPNPYIKNPSFFVSPYDFPYCKCDKQGEPLPSCQENTVKAIATFVVDVDGTTKNAILTKSTGSKKADKRILQEVNQTKFNPALQDNQPIKMRISQPIIINYIPRKNPLTCDMKKFKDKDL